MNNFQVQSLSRLLFCPAHPLSFTSCPLFCIPIKYVSALCLSFTSSKEVRTGNPFVPNICLNAGLHTQTPIILCLVPIDTSCFLVAEAVAISAGHMHTCAIKVRGDVYCWGFNDYGQLGTGDTDFHPSPTSVAGLQEGGHVFADACTWV